MPGPRCWRICWGRSRVAHRRGLARPARRRAAVHRDHRQRGCQPPTHPGARPVAAGPGAALARQALRYLYRILFLLYAEASPELEVLPVGAEEYDQGYGLDRLRELLSSPPADDDPDYRDGWMLPVLTLVGPDADDESKDDTCPSCQQKDSIRFLGSAIATLLSVTLSTLFGDEALDPREKKALVFTDSVQDAAHRAGFVESRSHTLTLRALLRHAVGDHPVSLDALVDRAIAAAGDDRFWRYRIIPPDLVEREEFAPFWRRPRAGEIPARVRTRVRRRLLFDAVLEFGLQSRVGRTLEQIGSAVVEVDSGEPAALASIARAVLGTGGVQDAFDGELAALTDDRLVTWVRGVLEHMRVQGAIEHEWFQEFIRHDGNRYFIWGGRPRGQGTPAFPRGRSAPAFPRIGPAAQVKDPLLDPVSTPRSWYARWTARALGVPAAYGARLAWQLLDRLARADILHTVATGTGGTVFTIPASSVVVSPTDLVQLLDGRNLHRLPDAAAGHRDGRRPARRRALHVRALPGAPVPRVPAGQLLPSVVRVDRHAPDRRQGAHRPSRRRHPAAVRERVQAVDQRPERAERACRDADARDGHRHRRPVRGAARVSAQDGRVPKSLLARRRNYAPSTGTRVTDFGVSTLADMAIWPTPTLL
jgi:hypothetical protein